MKQIRILRHGKDTKIKLSFETGVGKSTIMEQGSGAFGGTIYKTQMEATAFCRTELARDPAAILYIVSGNEILETILNPEYQQAREKRWKFLYVIASATAIFVISLLFSMFVMPFYSPLAHSLFTGGMMLFYMLCLFACGRRNFDAFIMMAVIFILLTVVFYHP